MIEDMELTKEMENSEFNERFKEINEEIENLKNHKRLLDLIMYK